MSYKYLHIEESEWAWSIKEAVRSCQYSCYANNIIEPNERKGMVGKSGTTFAARLFGDSYISHRTRLSLLNIRDAINNIRHQESIGVCSLEQRNDLKKMFMLVQRWQYSVYSAVSNGTAQRIKSIVWNLLLIISNAIWTIENLSSHSKIIWLARIHNSWNMDDYYN